MKYILDAQSCCVCLQKSKKSRSIHKPLEDEDESPKEMLEQITGLILEKMDSNEKTPENICKSCELSLNLAFEFREKAIKSQEIIEKHYKQLLEKGDNTSVSSEEMSGAQEFKQELEFIDEDYVDESNLSGQEEMQIEALDVPYPNIDYTEMNMDLLIDSYLEDPKAQEAKEDDKNIEEEEMDVMKVDIHSGEDVLDVEEQLDSSYDEKTKGSKTNNISNKSSHGSGRKSQSNFVIAQQRISIEPKSNRESVKKKSPIEQTEHMCDICGNIYAQRCRMMEHRRRHIKDLCFACEICDKRFYLREKLRKHMYLHTGGKPYKCSFCTRTFFYESVKKAHEKMHNDVRPFVCDVCDRAFTSPQSLKNHKLIHDGIKLYHCDYCDKDFRLQHHMKHHMQTKIHLEAVEYAESSKKRKHIERN